MDRLLVDVFLEAHREAPQEIILDLDATDDPLHGKQEGRFFHGYYGHYCYLPLYIFCGEFLLCAVAIVEHRCVGGKRGRVEAHRRTDSFRVAPGAYRGARRFWILPRGADGLV